MRLVALGILASAALATAAQADPVRYDFSGSLTTPNTSSGFASGAGLATGSGSFSGHVTFSDVAPDTDPSPAEFYDAFEFELIIGSFTFSGVNPGFDAASESVDPATQNFFLNFSSFSDFSALPDEFMSLTLSFANAVPGLAQNPSLAGATANLALINNDDVLFADGTVDRIVTTSSPVPEPATWAMLIGGFAVVGATMRSRRRAYLIKALA